MIATRHCQHCLPMMRKHAATSCLYLVLLWRCAHLTCCDSPASRICCVGEALRPKTRRGLKRPMVDCQSMAETVGLLCKPAGDRQLQTGKSGSCFHAPSCRDCNICPCLTTPRWNLALCIGQQQRGYQAGETRGSTASAQPQACWQGREIIVKHWQLKKQLPTGLEVSSMACSAVDSSHA